MKDKVMEHVLIALGALWTLLMPIQGLMLALGVLIGADLVTGVWKAVKQRQRITSRGWRATIGKSAIYLVAVLAGFSLDYIIANETPLVARAIALAIALTEIKSIFENFYAITGIDLIKFVMSRVKPSAEEEAILKPEQKSQDQGQSAQGQ